MRRPCRNQEDHYDAHKHMHCLGFLLGVDGVDGCCRYFNGHVPGRQNNLNNLYSSDLFQNTHLYLGIADKIVTDGIFRYSMPDEVIIQIGDLNRASSVEENNYNVAQRQCRSIVEHYNGRLKGYCGILRNYTFSIANINKLFISCLVITNIRVKYQDRMRDRN